MVRSIDADFFELEFSPGPAGADETFNKIREKIVLDFTIKALQYNKVL